MIGFSSMHAMNVSTSKVMSNTQQWEKVIDDEYNRAYAQRERARERNRQTDRQTDRQTEWDRARARARARARETSSLLLSSDVHLVCSSLIFSLSLGVSSTFACHPAKKSVWQQFLVFLVFAGRTCAGTHVHVLARTCACVIERMRMYGGKYRGRGKTQHPKGRGTLNS